MMMDAFLDAAANSRLFKLADESDSLEEGALGTISEDKHGLQSHISHTTSLSVIDTTTIKSRKFKVIVDTKWRCL